MSESESKSGTETGVQSVVHTLGPWRVRKPKNIHDISVCEYEVVGADGTKVCGIHNRIGGNPQLIAAAPAMREALQSILVETNFISLDAVRSYVAELLEFVEVV